MTSALRGMLVTSNVVGDNGIQKTEGKFLLRKKKSSFLTHTQKTKTGEKDRYGCS